VGKLSNLQAKYDIVDLTYPLWRTYNKNTAGRYHNRTIFNEQYKGFCKSPLWQETAY